MSEAILTFPTRPGHVLVADDEAKNRRLLKDLLEAQGHRVTEAVDGREALAKATEQTPDIILLDVLMPHMDGFQVCRSLKQDPGTASIYILIVTALSERDDRIKGIDAGANDFLSKPVDTREVLLRVRNAVHARHLQEQVQRGGTEQARLRRQVEDLTQALNSVLDAGRRPPGCMSLLQEPCDLVALAREVADDAAQERQERDITVDPARGSIAVWCDRKLVSQALLSLLRHALGTAPEPTVIRLALRAGDEMVRLLVSADGVSNIHAEGSSLLFCRFVAEAHGGRMGVQTIPGRQTAFWMELPEGGENLRNAAV